MTAALGLDVARFVTRAMSTTNGVRTVTFSNIEKIDRILDVTDSASIRLLTEVSIHQQRATQPGTSQPETWAAQSTTATSVTVLLDTLPQSTYNLQADGVSTVAYLTGTDEPVFAESFHDILTFSVIAEELLRKEKVALAREYATGDPNRPGRAERLLSELIHLYADSPTLKTRQGDSTITTGTSGGSGGGGTVGGTAYTQTGLITFDRDPSAPFAVTDTSAYVPNLFTEGVGNVAADRLIGRDTAGTGESEQLTVGNGLEFTGSGGIGIADDGVTFARMQNIATDRLIGRDTAATGSPEELTVGGGLEFTGSAGIQIANDGVTYARMQNVTAASRLLGRGSAAGAGDPEEITPSTGLTLSATTLTTDCAAAWTSVSFGAGNFTANGSMTWTVASGDQATFAYLKSGRTMTVAFVINTSTVGGTLNTQLLIAIPGGFTAAKAMFNACNIIDNNVSSIGYCFVTASGTTIGIARGDASNWSASTDLTYVRGQITFETTA